MRWERDIFGMVATSDWIDIGAIIPTRPTEPTDAIFSDEKTENLVAEWQYIASEFQIPVMAQFHGFDTEAQKTFRVPIDSNNIEKGLIKVKINQSERLRALMNRGVQGDERLYDYVLNDGLRLADQVITRTKVAKNELMATGKVSIHENDLDLVVDYGVPNAQRGYTIDLSPDADIASQIQAIVDGARDKGVIITGIMTSTKNITKMRQNAHLQAAINGNSAIGAQLSNNALKGYLDDEFGISTIITNDNTYGIYDGIDAANGRPKVKQEKFFPRNVVTFFSTNPAGKIGTGLWGNPPEVDTGQFYPVGGSSVSPYVYITQKMEWDPAVLWTKASGLFMPVLYNPNSLFIATVSEEILNTVNVSGMTEGSVFGVNVSTFQSGVSVSNGKVTGTLTKQTSGTLVNDWGAGYFLALKWDGIDDNATSLKVGLEPSEGTGLVEAISDPDKNGVFKITNKNVQKFKVVISNGKTSRVQLFDLSGLTLTQGA